MITVTGKYNSANVFIDDVDEATMTQIYSFLNHPAFAHTYIAIMPDCHAGAGAVIGFTAKLNEYIIPNVVGVDIGCGIEATKLEGIEKIDFNKLDKFIRKNIPSGFHKHPAPLNRNWEKFESYRLAIPRIETISEATAQDFGNVHCSLQTLGGGNHFIEIDKSDNGFWLVIHTGSRNFGLQIANWHQAIAKKLLNKMFMGADAYRNLEYLPMDMGGTTYLHEMKVAQSFAKVNRELIAAKIIHDFFDLEIDETVKSVHNYISDDGIIRKGAISAHQGEKLLIPLNMRDGVIFGTGKGNSKWNFSAPHGAGRVLSRRKAKEELNLEEFQETMKGVWTSCVHQSTLDESPMAYKDGTVITNLVGETITIDFVAKPVYNFKAS